LQPVSGEPLELRATTGGGVSQLWLERERSGSSERIAALRVQRVARSRAHCRRGDPPERRGRRSFRGSGRSGKVVLDELDAHESFRYRFAADDGSCTRWHTAVAAAWIAEGGVLSS